MEVAESAAASVALSDAGATVVAVDLDPSAAQGTEHKIECDLTDADASASVVDGVVAEFGGIDTLVNIAQWICPPRPFLDSTYDDLVRGFETGPIATFRMMQLCHPHLKARGGGAIINFGSGAGTQGGPGWGPYSAAKEAIRALAKVAATEWGVDNIRVNTICPVAGAPDDVFVSDALGGAHPAASDR